MVKKAIALLLIISIFTTYGTNIHNVYADGIGVSVQEQGNSDQFQLESVNTNGIDVRGQDRNELDLVPPHEKKKLSTYRKIMNHIYGTRQFKKKRGTKDPHYPRKIWIHPNLLKLPVELQIGGINDAIENENLNIDKITEEMIIQLASEDKNRLLEFLSKQTVRMRHECKGKWHAHPVKYLFHDKTNAAAALAFRMGARGELDGFTSILCGVPVALLPKLKGRAKSLLDQEVMARTMVCLMSQVNDDNLVPISQISTDLVQIYIKYWAGKDAERFDECLRNLIHRINELEGNMEQFSPQQFGVLLGSLLAGSLWVCSKLRSDDQKRQWMVNSIANLIRAFTPFLGVVPWIAGNAAAIVSGTISVAVVGTSVAYNYFRVPRDYSSIVRTVQGYVKLSALRSADKASVESRLRVQEMVEYMDAVINVNGEPA